MSKCDESHEPKNGLAIVNAISGRHFGKALYDSIKKRRNGNGCNAELPLLIDVGNRYFPDTSRTPIIPESVRGMDVVIVADVFNRMDPLCSRETDYFLQDGSFGKRRVKVPLSLAECVEDLEAIVDTISASAHSTSVVTPCIPYGRQDKRKKRESLNIKIFASRMEQAGADYLFTSDIHNTAAVSAFRAVECNPLFASRYLVGAINQLIDEKKHEGYEKFTIVSPDMGGANRARFYANKLGLFPAVISKVRDPETRKLLEMKILGDVTGAYCIFIDDMWDTFGTIENASMLLRENNVAGIAAAAIHPILSYPGYHRLADSHNNGYIDDYICTNSVYLSPEYKESVPSLRVIDISPMFAEVIDDINHSIPISDVLKGYDGQE